MTLGKDKPGDTASSKSVGPASGLLLGLLALQNNFVNRESLLAALGAWVADKSVPLGKLLVDRGVLDPGCRELLEALAKKHLEIHDGDHEKSLAALSVGRSTQVSLAGVGDGEFTESLKLVGSESVLADTFAQDSPTMTDPGSGSGSKSAYGPASIGSASAPGQRYRVLRPHAKGGLGAVFLALDTELNREVALKEIHELQADDPDNRQRFIKEAEVTGKLEHPGIVPVYGLGTYSGGRPYYAMRFIKGDSLKEAIEYFHSDKALRENPGLHSLELRKLLRRFLDVCNTIDYAHGRGVLHRDLKPGNIIVGRHGETLVVDWGLAKTLDQDESNEGLNEQHLVRSSGGGDTLPGSTLGTPAYMSPEQAIGDLDQLGPRSDVYSLGATLYCLLTGKPPFVDQVSIVLDRVKRGDFASPRKVDPSIDPAMEAICLKAMALRPEDRYATPKALADDIERWEADEPVSAYRERWSRRLTRFAKRHRQALLVSVALIVAATVSLAALVRVDHAQRLNRLQAELVRRLDVEDRSADTLRALEAKADALGRLDPALGLEARQRIHRSFARSLGEAMDRDPKLEPLAVARFQADLKELEARSPELADSMRKNLELRMGRVETIELSAPFSEDALKTFFEPGQVRVEGDGVIRSPAPTGAPKSALTLRPASPGTTRLAATFDESWANAPVVGLELEAKGGDRYRFLVATLGAEQPVRDGTPTPVSMETIRKAGGRLSVVILRNDFALGRTTMTPPDGPLRLEAGREGDSLTLQVNAGRPLVCEDPFPIGAGVVRGFGIDWPAGVKLQGLVLQRQRLPARPSPLERGDEHYARGEFEAALVAYQNQDQHRAPDDVPLDRQLRYKRALCLLGLGRKDEAASLLTEVMSDIDNAPPGAPIRWALRAACKLWLIRTEQNKGNEADRILERLSPIYQFETLAALIPAHEREAILDRYRQAGVWGTVAWTRANDLEQIERAIRVQDLLNSDEYDRRMTKWRLVDILRMGGDDDRALKVIRELLDDSAPPPDERIELFRDFVWMRINQGKEGALEAREQVNRVLEDERTRLDYLPLLIERARAEAALGHAEAAEKDCERFFAEVPRGRLHYAEFADACLLRGFLREQRGDHPGALAAWREGLFRNWPSGIPELNPSRGFDRVALRRRADTVTWGVLVGSLLGDITEAESDIFLDLLTGAGNFERTPAGGGDSIVRVFRKLGGLSKYANQVMLDEYSRPSEVEYARNMAFRRVSFRDYITVGLEIGILSGVRIGAYPEGVVPALEGTLRDSIKDLFRVYDEEKLVDADLIALVRLWWSLTLSPSNLWKTTLAAHLDPSLRTRVAYALGNRYKTLGQPGNASLFFQDVLDHEADYPLLAPYAREALERLKNTPAR